ncbi:hypothetical protein OH77DRAFT_1438736 [Trametes cingulata]|nr:hypothetical protein OH77DRAFT_1438736 [Trametes cingulata]
MAAGVLSERLSIQQLPASPRRPLSSVEHLDEISSDLRSKGLDDKLEERVSAPGLLRKAAASYAWCPKANAVARAVCEVGESLPQRITKAIDKHTLVLEAEHCVRHAKSDPTEMSQTPDSAPSPDPSQAYAKAPHPFNQPSADIILRTCDRVDFHVHSPILAQASPFFADMLALPQPPAHSPSGAGAKPPGTHAPVVDVPEDSETLELLLRLLYPIAKPKTEDPRTMVPVLKAATKYDMEWPVQILSERLVAVIPREPLQAWAAACRAGLEDVARQAANALKVSADAKRPDASSDKKDVQPEALSIMEELKRMDGISAADYFRLKQLLRGQQPESAPLLSPPSGAPVPAAQSPVPWFETDMPSTDVICRRYGQNGTTRTFAAHQVVLAIHSPVLRTRLAEIRSDSDILEGELAELCFEESPDTLSSLLHACYGRTDELPLSLPVLAQLLTAARKYEMTHVSRDALGAWNKAASLRPLEAYFVAVQYRLDECAREAARLASKQVDVNAYDPVMEDAPALAYHRFLDYYDACCRVVLERVNKVCSGFDSDVYWNSGYTGTRKLRDALMGTHERSEDRPGKDLTTVLHGILSTSVTVSDNYGYGYNEDTRAARAFLPTIIDMLGKMPREVELARAQISSLTSRGLLTGYHHTTRPSLEHESEYGVLAHRASSESSWLIWAVPIAL